MIDVGKDGILTNNVINLPELNDVCFLESLHREEVPRFFTLAKHHTTKGTGTKRSCKLVFRQVYLAFRGHVFYLSILFK